MFVPIRYDFSKVQAAFVGQLDPVRFNYFNPGKRALKRVNANDAPSAYHRFQSHFVLFHPCHIVFFGKTNLR